MNFKKLESGRSMVEMLGVLAIIGVLSVGGIAGYSLSMRRHRANQIVDSVAKYALVSYGQCQKIIIEGSSSWKDVDDCVTGSSFPSFKETGVGIEPAGVHINLPGFKTDATTGIDTVIVSAAFDDDKLCQAVASVAGSTCNNGLVYIQIKQN